MVLSYLWINKHYEMLNTGFVNIFGVWRQQQSHDPLAIDNIAVGSAHSYRPSPTISVTMLDATRMLSADESLTLYVIT